MSQGSLRKMSILIQHKSTFADVKAALGSTRTAVTNVDTLKVKTNFISPGSTLKGGDDQRMVLSDLERFQDPVEHKVDSSAKAGSLHFVSTCTKIRVDLRENINILVLPGQEWSGRNVSDTTLYVNRSHIGPDDKQHMRYPVKLSPGMTTTLHN